MTALLTLLDHEADHVEVGADGHDNPVIDGTNRDTTSATATSTAASQIPDWVNTQLVTWGEALVVPEWQEHTLNDDIHYRTKHGWQGRDLIHDQDAPVRIWSYHVVYGPGVTQSTNVADRNGSTPRGGVGTTLRGVVHFTKRAESHQGYCHGGSMTSVLDDVIGWVAFLVTGECRPWTGFTVQVNCSLQRPIPVDSLLMVQAKITHIERRKVSVEASIVDPSSKDGGDGDASSDSDGDVVVHATGTGLVVMNRGVLPHT